MPSVQHLHEVHSTSASQLHYTALIPFPVALSLLFAPLFRPSYIPTSLPPTFLTLQFFSILYPATCLHSASATTDSFSFATIVKEAVPALHLHLDFTTPVPSGREASHRNKYVPEPLPSSVHKHNISSSSLYLSHLGLLRHPFRAKSQMSIETISKSCYCS